MSMVTVRRMQCTKCTDSHKVNIVTAVVVVVIVVDIAIQWQIIYYYENPKVIHI